MQRHLRFRDFGLFHTRVLMGLMMVGLLVRTASAAPAHIAQDCTWLSFLVG